MRLGKRIQVLKDKIERIIQISKTLVWIKRKWYNSVEFLKWIGLLQVQIPVVSETAYSSECMTNLTESSGKKGKRRSYQADYEQKKAKE